MSDDTADRPISESASRTIEDLLDGDVHFAMVMTMIDGKHSSRPVTVVEVADGRLSFLVNGTTDWAEAIAAGRADVHITIAEQVKNTYLAMNGTATVTSSQPDIDRLWNPAAGIYFDGKDDPNVRVLQFDVTEGEWWDGPSGRIGQAVAMVRAKLTDAPEKTGSQGSIAPG